MSNPTRPVWMLPATGAALATTASLIGGINVDDPNVVPSVKAKKLLRTLVLGAAAGLGAEAMLRGGGIAYRGLMSKSSSAEQIKRFRNKTLYSLIKQGAEGEPNVPSVAPVPADPIENESQLTSPAAPTTPTTPTQPPAENNPLAPPATTTPDTTKEAPTKEPWHRQSPAGFPNGYIGYGLGGLLGAGLLYHFLTEKKKRKPSGYLNSMGAGLLAGLLGYGLYDFSQGGSSKEKGEPKQRYKLPEEVSILPNTGVLSDYEIETDENGLPKYDNNGKPIPLKPRSSEERRALEIRNQELANNRETQRFNNNSLKPLNFAWYTSNNDAVNTKVNQSINWELNNNSQFSKMMTSFVMGASLNEAYYDKQTAPEFQRNIQEYDQVMCQNAQKQITQNIQDILIREGIPEEQAPAQAAEVFNYIYNFYKSDPRAIPYKATTLAEDISTHAFNSNLAQFSPNDVRLPGYTKEMGGNRETTAYALRSMIPHIEWRMGRRLSEQEKDTLLGLTKNLRVHLHNMDEAAKRGDYTVPGGQDYFGKGSYQPWWYEGYAKVFGIRRQQAMDRAQNWANDRAKVLKAKNDIKDFFVGVLAKPVNTAPTVAPTTTEVPVLNNTSPIPQNPTAAAPTGQPATPTTPVVPVVGSEPSATNGGVVPPNTVAPAQPNVQKVEEEDRDNTIVPGIGPDGGNKPSLRLSPEARDILIALGVGGGTGATWVGANKYFRPPTSPVVPRPMLTVGSKPKPTDFIPHSPQADALVEGAITPEEYLYPGITQEREAYSARITDPITGEIDYAELQNVSNKELQSLEAQFKTAKNTAQTAPTAAEREIARNECKILQEKINKVKPWTQLGGNASIPGAGNTANFTTPERQLEEWVNYKKLDNPISKELQEAYTNLNTRLNQIDEFQLTNNTKDLLKREAISDFLKIDEELRAGKNANPVFNGWKNNYTLALDKENLPWKYRLSSKEIASVADSPLKQAILEKPAIPGMSFGNAVTYLNEPELAKATKELKDANAHLQEVQKLNQAKIKAGIKPNPLDVERANRNIKLAQNRIQQLKAKITYGSIYGEKTLGKDWKLLQNIPYTEASPADMAQKILRVRTPDPAINVEGKVPLNYNYAPIADKRRILEKAIVEFGEDHPVTREAAKNFKTEAARIIKDHVNNLSKRSMTPGAFKGKINNPGIEYLNELANGSDKYLAEAANEIIAEVNKAGLPKPVVYSKRPASKIPSLKAEAIAKAPSTVGKVGKIFAKALTPAYLFSKGWTDVNTPYADNKERVFAKAVNSRSWAERMSQTAYDAAIAQGKSEDEAKLEADKAWVTSQGLGGIWGLVNRIPTLAAETVNIPSYLYNLGEDAASFGGLKTEPVPIANTDKLTLYNLLGGNIKDSWGQLGENIGQGMSNLVPIVGRSIKHQVTRPLEVINNAVDSALDKTPRVDPVKIEKQQIDNQYAVYNKLWKQRAYDSGFTPDDLDPGLGADISSVVHAKDLRDQLGFITAKEWKAMTPEAREKAIKRIQNPIPKVTTNNMEYRIPAKNITQDHFKLALSLVGKDDKTKAKVLSKLSPFNQSAVIQIINDMENTVQY